MTIDEYTSLTRELASGDADEARTSQILVSLTDAFTESSSNLENAQNEITKLTDSNTSLKQANYELFLRIGSKPSDTPDASEQTVKTPEDYTAEIGEYR